MSLPAIVPPIDPSAQPLAAGLIHASTAADPAASKMFGPRQAQWHQEMQALADKVQKTDDDLAKAVEELNTRERVVQMLKGVLKTLSRQFRPRASVVTDGEMVPVKYQEPEGFMARQVEKLTCLIVLFPPVKAWRAWRVVKSERVANRQLRRTIGDCHQRLTEQVVQFRREMPRVRRKENSLARSNQQALKQADRADQIGSEVVDPGFAATTAQLTTLVSELEAALEKLASDCTGLEGQISPAAKTP